ncbi:MAG: hypothetical protein QNJ97_00795 [Myxococcota bacterium]|nr:hypothetical protein [Myxococcota bacterium]
MYFKGFKKLIFSVLYAIACLSTPSALAQSPNNGEEEVIDLESLEDEPSEASKGGADDGEALLPISASFVEVERRPWLSLVALIVLVPVAAMLLPPVRIRRGRGRQTQVKQR